MLGMAEGGKRRRQQRMRWLDNITDSMDMSEQIPGYTGGQRSLAAAWSPQSCEESDTI